MSPAARFEPRSPQSMAVRLIPAAQSQFCCNKCVCLSFVFKVFHFDFFALFLPALSFCGLLFCSIPLSLSALRSFVLVNQPMQISFSESLKELVRNSWRVACSKEIAGMGHALGDSGLRIFPMGLALCGPFHLWKASLGS